jgi:SAM-dependent methyltransferase
MTPDEIAGLMLVSSDVQPIQTRFRCTMVDFWAIAAGSRVLEIACGQGDTTAILADRVGPDGQVVASDPAPADYGSPVAVGQSLAHLQAGPLGARIDVRLGADYASYDGQFDYAVLALGSWYFSSRAELYESLRRLRSTARTLCFAEWDLVPTALEQVPHLLAVLIQGQSVDPGSNVRTPLSREQTLEVVADAGWTVTDQTVLDTSTMHDARWEIGMALDRPADSDLLATQLAVLRKLSSEVSVRPLSSYALTAS